MTWQNRKLATKIFHKLCNTFVASFHHALNRRRGKIAWYTAWCWLQRGVWLTAPTRSGVWQPCVAALHMAALFSGRWCKDSSSAGLRYQVLGARGYPETQHGACLAPQLPWGLRCKAYPGAGLQWAPQVTKPEQVDRFAPCFPGNCGERHLMPPSHRDPRTTQFSVMMILGSPYTGR